MKSDKKMAIMVTAIMVISVFALVVPTSAVGGGSVEVNKTVWDPVGQTWVKELNASIDDTLRFRCEIQYCYDVDGYGSPSNKRFWDVLDCSLEFADNATLNGGDYEELNAANNFTFKPKVLHPDNLSWDPYAPQLYVEQFDELCPNVSNSYQIDLWYDTSPKDDRISACDQIYLTSAPGVWYHVDNVPCTLNVTNITTGEQMYIDSVLDYKAVNLNNPNGTEWLEVCCCKDRYNLSAWSDDGDGNLSVADTILLNNTRTGEATEYTVEEVTIDLVVSKEWELGGVDSAGTDDLGGTSIGVDGVMCDDYTIEYDAIVVRCGVDNNTFRAKGKWQQYVLGEGKVSNDGGYWVYSAPDTVTITVSCISGEATDAVGGTKDVYTTTETVYATGSGFEPNSLVNIYITEDKHWIDSMHINSTVYARKDNVSADTNGNIVGEEMWPNPIPGEYDMVFDANQNGFYDVGIDAIDDPNDPGFTVLGQVPALTPIGLAALVGLLAIIATSTILRKRKKR